MLEELYPFSIQYLNNSIESGQIQIVGFTTKNARRIRFKTHSDNTIETKFKDISLKVYALAIIFSIIRINSNRKIQLIKNLMIRNII